VKIVRTIKAVRDARRGFGDIGFVPTMGFLHGGHLSLVDLARSDCGASAVSIFVNPTQFGPHEDLSRYPRDLPRDLDLLQQVGTDLVFIPDDSELYPPGFSSRVEVGAIGDVLEGAIRPGHFSGVATIVTKLLNIVQPTRAYFGQKDAQQSIIIRKIVRDLDVPVEINVGPTLRETDGLAMSSRNVYLTQSQRANAPILYKALSAARDAFQSGVRDAALLRTKMKTALSKAEVTSVDYVSVANLATLQEMDHIDQSVLISLAVRFGSTRLIDNMVLEVS